MPPRKRSNGTSTVVSSGAKTSSAAGGGSAAPRTKRAAPSATTVPPPPHQHQQQQQQSSSTTSSTTSSAGLRTLPAADAAAVRGGWRAFHRTGHLAVAPPHTVMDLLRLCVDAHLLHTRAAAPPLHGRHGATADPSAHAGVDGMSRSSNGSSSIRPPPASAEDVAEQQAATLLSVCVPHRVSSFFANSALLPDADEAAAATAAATEAVAAPAEGRKRRRSTAAELAEQDDGGDADKAAPLVPAVVLQRLCDYGAARVPGFESDSAYLAAKDVLVYLRHYVNIASGMSLHAGVLRSVELAGLNFRQHCVPCMDAVVHVFDHLVRAQLHKMAQPPRLVRLSTRLGLSAKTTSTLEYLLLCHCGRYTPSHLSDPLRPASIATHNELSPQELLSSLSDSSVLCKQGLVFSDAKMHGSFMECRYALPLEAVAALSGDQLSEENLIKLERTVLSEVLSEERQSATPTACAATAAATAAAAAAPAPSAATTATVVPRRRASRERADTHSADAEEDEEDEEGGSSYDEEDEEDDATGGSSADSAVTLTEDALDGVLDGIDPALLASADADAIEAAVLQRLGRDAASAAATPATTAAEEEATAGPTSPPPPVQGPTHDGDAPAASVTAPTSGASVRLTLADINPFAQRYRNATSAAAASAAGAPPPPDASMRNMPYTSDIEYMDAAFRILANLIRIRYAEGDMKDEDDAYTPKSKVEASIRELKGRVRIAAAVHESRLSATMAAADAFTPRIEGLAKHLKLTEMEKQILLFMVGNVVSHDVLVAVNGRYVMRDGQRVITVGYILFVLCESLEERVVARRAFYQSAPLVSHGILSLTLELAGRSCFNTDLMEYLVDIDRKIVDDVMGIAAETAEMVPGSQLYFPAVELANVVLPASTMDRVLSTIQHYSLFEQCRRSSGFGAGLGTSTGGLVMLFHGPSGTGKTMLANAVAHHLKRKLLLVSVAQFRSSAKTESDALRFLFREAKLSDAIVFFDECESLFEDRTSNATVTALLSEFERYDGLVILATNRAQNFDDAMNRRISLMMDFRLPDHQLRLRIWRSHIPTQLVLADDVSLEKLALNYELSGGLIRNAVLAALSRAVAREKSVKPTLTMADLDEGARLQLRGFFLAAERPAGMSEFYVTPKRTLAELVLEPSVAKRLDWIASVAKSRSTLYTQWGFSEDANDDCGTLYLFQGVSGTGKSVAAEGIAYECGAAIRLCNVAELLLREEMQVHAVFEEGRRLGAIIVFDAAQVLFNESPKSLQLSQLIEYHVRRYPRPVIVIATTTSRDGSGGRQLFSTTSVNPRASCMQFQEELTFSLPSRPLREQLWRRAFPEHAPTAPDVDYARLSAATISPKLIRAVAFSVCCTAALLPVTERVVTMAMIEAELEKTAMRERSAISASTMFA